jgi:hypothetical protein
VTLSKYAGLGLLVAVFVFGAIVLWMGAPKAETNASTLQGQSSSAEGDEMPSAELTEVRTYVREKFLIDENASNQQWPDLSWGRNPFLMSSEMRCWTENPLQVTEDAAAGETGAKAPQAKLVLISDKKRIALIEDGQFLSVGDPLGNDVVTKIDANGIVIAGQNGTSRIDTPASKVRLKTDTK